MIYLVMKYAKNDSLYPRDPKQRAIVEHRLYFDIGSLLDSIVDCYVSLIVLICNIISRLKRKYKLHESWQTRRIVY
jgi:hypothetical protein